MRQHFLFLFSEEPCLMSFKDSLKFVTPLDKNTIEIGKLGVDELPEFRGDVMKLMIYRPSNKTYFDCYVYQENYNTIFLESRLNDAYFISVSSKEL